MDTKHTAGQWYGKDGQIYPTETGKTLALLPYFDKDNEEHQANQKLIAAAPLLLEALKEMVRMYEEVQPAGGWQGVYEESRYAISEATN